MWNIFKRFCTPTISAATFSEAMITTPSGGLRYPPIIDTRLQWLRDLTKATAVHYDPATQYYEMYNCKMSGFAVNDWYLIVEMHQRAQGFTVVEVRGDSVVFKKDRNPYPLWVLVNGERVLIDTK